MCSRETAPTHHSTLLHLSALPHNIGQIRILDQLETKEFAENPRSDSDL